MSSVTEPVSVTDTWTQSPNSVTDTPPHTLHPWGKVSDILDMNVYYGLRICIIIVVVRSSEEKLFSNETHKKNGKVEELREEEEKQEDGKNRS